MISITKNVQKQFIFCENNWPETRRLFETGTAEHSRVHESRPLISLFQQRRLNFLSHFSLSVQTFAVNLNVLLSVQFERAYRDISSMSNYSYRK